MSLQLTLAARYLGGRRLRTFLTTLAIVFGVLVLFGMNTILPAFIQSFTANALAMAGQVDVTITHKTGGAFPVATLDQVRAIGGVRVASGTLERPINLPQDYLDHDPTRPDRVAAVTLVGADPEAFRTVTAINLVAGRWLEAGDQAAAVIAESLAEVAGVQVGDSLTLPTATGAVDLTVAGILPQRLLPGNEEVLVPLPAAQKWLAMPGQINVIDANLDSVEDARRAEIESAIEAAVGANYTIGVLQAGAEMLTNLKTAQIVMNLFGVLALLMGGFIIFNTFRTIVAERRRDIGMLRAVGASRRTITGLILVEGLIQGTLGTAAGLLVGYLFGALLLAAVGPILREFLNIQVGGPVVTPGVALVAILMGVGITVLAGVLPARAASRVAPLEALRPAVDGASTKRMAGLGFWSGVAMIAVAVVALVSGNSAFIGLGAILFVVGLMLIAPAMVNPIARLFGRLLALVFARQGTTHLAEGNLRRQPGRAAITASTTLIALAVLVMAGSIISSLTISFTTMLRKSFSSDFLLLPPSLMVWGTNVGAGPHLAEGLRAVDGVGVVSSLRFAGTVLNDVPVGLQGLDLAAYRQTGGLTFSQGDPEMAYRALETGRAIVVNGPLAMATHVKMGDPVTLLTPAGEVTYQIVGIASDYMNAKTTTGYISQANIEADFGATEDVLFQINARHGADLDAVEAGLKETLAPYPQFKLVAGAEFVEQNAGLFDTIFAGFYVMMVFLAIPSLIAMVNTLAIGVIERTREIGTLRAVGATRRQVRTVVLAEALILAAIGTAFGLLAGLYLGYLATNAFEALGFPLEYAFPAAGVIAGVAVGLLCGALAAVIPARQAARLNVVQALRYE